MFKTCFECRHIKEVPKKRGRIMFYCPKLSISGKLFIIDKMGHRPKICPLCKAKVRSNHKRTFKFDCLVQSWCIKFK